MEHGVSSSTSGRQSGRLARHRPGSWLLLTSRHAWPPVINKILLSLSLSVWEAGSSQRAKTPPMLSKGPHSSLYGRINHMKSGMTYTFVYVWWAGRRVKHHYKDPWRWTPSGNKLVWKTNSLLRQTTHRYTPLEAFPMDVLILVTADTKKCSNVSDRTSIVNYFWH